MKRFLGQTTAWRRVPPESAVVLLLIQDPNERTPPRLGAEEALVQSTTR